MAWLVRAQAPHAWRNSAGRNPFCGFAFRRFWRWVLALITEEPIVFETTREKETMEKSVWKGGRVHVWLI